MVTTVLAQLGGLRGLEWVILAILIIVLLIKGPEHIPQLARAVGKARGEYEKGKQELQEEIARADDRASLEEAARGLDIDTAGRSDEELKAAIAAAVEEE